MAAPQQRSDQQTGGRYVQGGTVDVNGRRLGWWERKVFTKSPTDIPFTITSQYARRPDKLAYDLYGRASLQWFIMQYNNISDLNVDFLVGAKITLPTASRLFSELLTKSS